MFKLIPSFRPSIDYDELNAVMLKISLFLPAYQQVRAFEEAFVRYLGVKGVVSVPSGRWGLYYILRNLDLKEGDEVILPAFTYFAVPAVICALGLKPVFVDINENNLNINISEAEKSITEKTKAIIPAHLCGFSCDLDALQVIARKYNINIIEDCAQSLGAEYSGRKTGSFGKAAYFTFGITKNFTMLGGGMVATNNEELADSVRKDIETIFLVNRRTIFLRILKAYFMKQATSRLLFPLTYSFMRIFSLLGVDLIDALFREHESLPARPPFRGQPDNIQAELGIKELEKVDMRNNARRKIGLELYERLKGIKNIRIPEMNKEAKDIFSSCPILVGNKKYLKKALLRRGIDTSAGYMQDCSRLPLFWKFKKHCPCASKAEDEVLYLPLYAELSKPEIMYITDMVKKTIA